jgi:hypothetical protein
MSREPVRTQGPDGVKTVKHLHAARIRLAVAALIVLSAAACTPVGGATQPAPTPAPDTPTIPPSPTPTVAETATSRPTDEPTATPTDTPGPAPTSTHQPTVTPASPPNVTVTPAPPPVGSITPPTPTPTPTPVSYELIERFEADPTTIDPGDSVTLSWSARGDWATLYTLLPDLTLGQWWDVPLEGSRVVTTSEGVRNWARYALFVGEGDRMETRSVEIAVRCTAAWFFTPEPDLCPLDPVFEAAAAYQPFEGGQMIWLAGKDWIIVLYGDSGIPAYSIFANLWEEGMPESDPDIAPPAGRYQPVRGFGLVWRGELDAAEYYDVRGRLGWATAPEESYTARYQCDSPPKYTTCYLSGPSGEIYELGPEHSAWLVLEAQMR